jgi:hypothetical protein
VFNLYQIISGAQGGQAIDNLARQFGLSRDQADTAIKSLMPALSTAFTTKAMQPGGMQDLAGAMDDDQHKQAYADPNAAQDPQTQQKGGAVAGDIFGNSAIVQQVLQQASAYTHIPVATLEQMLPVIVSMVMGGVATAMRNQGMGGWLGQLANSGFGGILGQMSGQPGTQQPGGGLGGMFGSILSSMLGGGQAGGTQPAGAQAGAPPESASPAGAGMSPAMRAGMDALGKMFQPGVSSTGAQRDDLGDQISSILGGKRG